LALSLFHAGNLDEALEHLEESAALTPEYLMANYHMGVVHERRNQPDKAARSFQRAIDELVGEVSSVYRLARLRQAQGDEEQAEALLKRTREFARSNGVMSATTSDKS
jgi:tetratricopeptide (TPR) repeat protein